VRKESVGFQSGLCHCSRGCIDCDQDVVKKTVPHMALNVGKELGSMVFNEEKEGGD
jgi:hypothetical protein